MKNIILLTTLLTMLTIILKCAPLPIWLLEIFALLWCINGIVIVHEVIVYFIEWRKQ